MLLLCLDPIDCDTDPCHLEWLTRYNPYLSLGVDGLHCSDSNNQLLNVPHNLALHSLLSGENKSSTNNEKCQTVIHFFSIHVVINLIIIFIK